MDSPAWLDIRPYVNIDTDGEHIFTVSAGSTARAASPDMPRPTADRSPFSSILTDADLELPITLAGVGSVGFQILRMLVAMGFTDICVYDPDVVTSTNIHTQGYPFAALGRPKVEVAIALVQPLLLDNQNIFGAQEPLPRKHDNDGHVEAVSNGILIVCVDSMLARKNLFQTYDPKLLIDTRCAAETAQVLCCWDVPTRDLYEATLFDDSEASPEPCGYRSTIYNATLAASMAMQALTRWCRTFPVDWRTTYHAASSIFHAEAPTTE